MPICGRQPNGIVSFQSARVAVVARGLWDMASSSSGKYVSFLQDVFVSLRLVLVVLI